MKMKYFSKVCAFALAIQLAMLPAAPAFALGEVVVDANIAPASQPAPAASTPSVAAPAPVVEIIAAGDTVPPHVSSVLAISILPTEQNIAWTTDELATSRLEYGTTSSYGSSVTLSATAGLAHVAVLTGLAPSKRYYYCIHSTDLAGNVADSCGHEFTTEVQASAQHLIDTTAPDISLVTVTSVDAANATISWTTGEVANAEVEYGTTAGYGSATALDTSLSLNHAVTLHDLAPNTEYHYRIRTADEIGNTAVSPDNTFTTASVASGQASVNSEAGAGIGNADFSAQVVISGVETASVSAHGATISWTTDLLSDSQVEYGDSQDLGSLSALGTTLTTSHSITLSDLSENTNYIFRVKSKPVGTSVAVVSGLHEFTTLAHSAPVIAPANVSAVASSGVTASGATIVWTTDKGATSQVEYGVSTGYGEYSAQNSNLAQSHSVALSGLDEQTTYRYRVKSTDAAGNVTFSADHSFTTRPSQSSGGQASSNVAAPQAISNLSMGEHDASSAALVWRTATENADVSLEYDIRYGISPITESNYGSATEAQLTPVYHGDLDPQGTEREYVVAGLDPDTTYYFAIRSKHQHSDWSPVSNVVSTKTATRAGVSAEPSHGRSSGNGGGSGGGASSSFGPTALKVEPANGQIVFEWNNPGESDFVRTAIVRKEGGYPASPSDGRTIYEGRGQTFADTGVANDTTYYYALYSYNHSKTYSSPVRVSLAPKAGNDQIKFNETGSLVPFAPVMHFTRAYKRGDANVEIEHLQEILALEGVSFPENLITGYFGGITEKALKRFQEKYGLMRSGVIDAATQAKLRFISTTEKRLEVTGDLALFDNDLKLGNQGETVKALQEFLAYEGSYPEAKVSGHFGPLTKSAVMKFQKKYAIEPPAGYVGYKTRHRMQQLTGL